MKRILIQQPALPKYRVPYFREIMSRPGMSVKLFYSSVDRSLANESVPDLNAEYIPMKLVKVGPANLMWHAAQLRGARRGACDILVLSWNVQYIGLIPALLLARLNGIKTILWGHGYSKNETRFRKMIRDAVGKLADALLFYDFATADQYITDGWAKEKIHVAPNSLDQSLIQQTRADWIDDQNRLHLFQGKHGLEGKKNIIFIGRVYEENRLDILIKTLPLIKKKHPEIQLLVIGKVNAVVEDLRQLAKDLEVDDSIQWLGAMYEEHEIAPYMLSSSLFCYPANIGLSIMHAMGYGVPVITGNDIPSHNPEIHVLEDGRNGLLFKHLDVHDLSSRISAVLSRPQELVSMGNAARDSILQSFTVEKMADGFCGAVQALSHEDADGP